MSTLNQTSSFIPGFIKRYFNYTLESRLPSKTKRLIYISSILGVIEASKDPDKRLIAKLNEVFHIAKYQDSFLFPIHINRFIWPKMENVIIKCDGRDIPLKGISQTELTDKERKVISEYFFKNTPRWLSYGSKNLMVADVSSLIKEVTKFKSVQA